ncbi:conserved Plasmodium protein, unknown function [Plasmodium yoelii]|uniref:Uncharacterized protein n=2 Tax=Plasmodium yoelii TaxID=5861 RepID=A0AAE9WKH4_PLAYO|nr:conserved Plasmodium protein, unknown function [Plasmodium yoelii]WBY55360.1 hypothetical protein Py17XNL_000403967 [Plasmodium yoelii yoelii]CDU16524.1 conserved Plasmodium protein, unknown function [Plasmodium yoelii]VTZ73388.1 conserved Plasmodium protein, unknown function [Plasmodium yoelii]|eukprot:XP_022811576.1 conserved Plasmodium protein, unknown function [Plasmodium yoelii]
MKGKWIVKYFKSIIEKNTHTTIYFQVKRQFINVPKLKTLQCMEIENVRKHAELCQKKNIKTKYIWDNILYTLVLKLCNNEIKNYVDFMIILKLLSKYISLEEKVLNFICEKLEHEMYKLTIRELSLLLLILKKNKYDNAYFINLITKSILMRMNKNMSYKDLSLIIYSLSKNIHITEKVYTNDMFNLTILKIYNEFQNINFHSLSLFFYSYSLYFLNNTNYLNSFFYIIKNFIKIIKKNIYHFNSTDLMFTYISTLHIYNSFIKTNNSPNCDDNNNIPFITPKKYIQPSSFNLLCTNVKELQNQTNSEKENTNLQICYEENSITNINKNSIINSKCDLLNDHIDVTNSLANKEVKEIKLRQKNSELESNKNELTNYEKNGEKNKQTLEDLMKTIHTVIVEKLKSFKIEEVINILFASLNKNLTINKKYFNVFKKQRININDYINIYIKSDYKEFETVQENFVSNEEDKIGRMGIHNNNSPNETYDDNYILRIVNPNLDTDNFTNIIIDEIIYRNECLSIKQIILLLYLLRKSNLMFIRFEKIILKRLVCLEKKLNKNEVMFIYQHLFLRTCLFDELKRYPIKIYEQVENNFLIYVDKNNEKEDEWKYENKNNDKENENGKCLINSNQNTEQETYYMIDDPLYLEKKKKRDKIKIFVHNNYISKYPAYAICNDQYENCLNEKKNNMKYFIDFIKLKKKIEKNIISEENGLTHNQMEKWKKNSNNNEIYESRQFDESHNIINNHLSTNVEKTYNNILSPNKTNIFNNREETYKGVFFNLCLDIYKIVSIKLLHNLKNEKLSNYDIIDILCIYEKLNVRDYRIIKYMYNLKKDILYMPNNYIIKIMNIILNFNLYSILKYLNINQIIEFINFNSINECLDFLLLTGMLQSRNDIFQNSKNNLLSLNAKNMICYLLKNINQVKNLNKMQKINLTKVYNFLPLKFYKLFKNYGNIQSLNKKLNEEKENNNFMSDNLLHTLCGKIPKDDLKNIVTFNVDDLNIKCVGIETCNYYIEGMKHIKTLNYLKKYSISKDYLNTFRDIKDEIYQDLLLMYNTNLEIYKNINISNFMFPLAINLLTINNNEQINKNTNLIKLKKNDDHKYINDIIELNKNNFLIIDILYNYNFYYSLNSNKENQLKKNNVYISYYSSHINKNNKRILNYKKYIIYKLIKKRGYNYISIDAKTYVKNKKINFDNSLNKNYINNLIFDLMKRQKNKNVYSMQRNKNPFKIHKILSFHLKNQINKKINSIKRVPQFSHPSFYIQNKRKNMKNRKTYMEEKTNIMNFVDEIEQDKTTKGKLPSNHLSKLRNMFQFA